MKPFCNNLKEDLTFETRIRLFHVLKLLKWLFAQIFFTIFRRIIVHKIIALRDLLVWKKSGFFLQNKNKRLDQSYFFIVRAKTFSRPIIKKKYFNLILVNKHVRSWNFWILLYQTIMSGGELLEMRLLNSHLLDTFGSKSIARHKF